ncbi:MAG: hypothetical protein IPP48_02215 [Chitinophagaceae bacterium]|nr:hypothetical protein [Chitinophagaceae bacterium]
MKKIFILSFLILSFVSKAQISITNITTPYTQDFNTLATSGTSSLLPNSWFF